MRIARRDDERREDDDRPDAVREDVTHDDPHIARAGGLRRLDELLLAEREEEAAHDSCEPDPEEQGEDEADLHRLRNRHGHGPRLTSEASDPK